MPFSRSYSENLFAERLEFRVDRVMNKNEQWHEALRRNVTFLTEVQEDTGQRVIDLTLFKDSKQITQTFVLFMVTKLLIEELK